MRKREYGFRFGRWDLVVAVNRRPWRVKWELDIDGMHLRVMVHPCNAIQNTSAREC